MEPKLIGRELICRGLLGPGEGGREMVVQFSVGVVGSDLSFREYEMLLILLVDVRR